MKKYILLLFLFCLLLSGCKKKEEDQKKDDDPIDNPPVEHVCTEFEWAWPEGTKCGQKVGVFYQCVECGAAIDYQEKTRTHEKYAEDLESTCEKCGTYDEYCCNCDYHFHIDYPILDHSNFEYEIMYEATSTDLGKKKKRCSDCGADLGDVYYAANGFLDHGKLSVNGADLVDKNGKKFQLYGLSTHGIQWCSNFINFESFDALHNEFGNNVIRLSLYPSEGGYCDCTPEYKEFLYQKVVEGIKVCTALDMYVIVDWHMVGAVSEADGNPLTYKEESMEFFERITTEFKDYDNILYEIMNEPCGPTTWEQCKIYANMVIPIIRKNTDGIILVGNPHWSADLASVMKSPLEGYDNIMYTYHFYAAGSYNMSVVEKAYTNGFPVFISEHGGMGSDGDGEINEPGVKQWYQMLDKYNISYVAWNISNTKGSASIVKHSSTLYTDFSDSNLKVWGVFYKKILRAKSGLNKLDD